MSLVFCGVLLALSGAAWAETDKEIQEKALMQRDALKHGGGAMEHAEHGGSADESANKYRGVFYGYLPCTESPDCAGLKMTLSLKHNGSYLLIIQPARPRNRETFEKGTYTWDDKNATVMLTPYNKDKPQRRLTVKSETSLLYVNNDGTAMPGSQSAYMLERSDAAGNREMHIH
ncbi:copper resistance protein NlpE N-terminal domain-containing protein [Methylogaea oryzae]|uniref:copper resistance protein NlpE N-terminal domain-containing protein n=1 Tax=Methylogaea oryzae TaxID=1295382 RepID=UPI001FE9BC2A|nr:copper resistance protein NlpE N-terminal domain-containing protein [Methylogaea oryzae]